MFDFDISLFILSMWIIVIKYILIVVKVNNVWISIMSYFNFSSDHGGYTDYKVEIQKESEG